MASRQGRSNRIYNWHAAPWQIDARITIGASGAPTLVTSSTIPASSPAATTQQSQGVKSITRLTTGTYRIQLDDNYTSLLFMEGMFTAPVSGSAIAVDATTAGLSSGTIYQIVTVGTATTAANWATLGLPAGIPAAVGAIFKAANTGTGVQSGAGTVKAIGTTAVAGGIQLLGTPDTMLNNQPFTQGSGGGYINFQTLGQAFTGSALATHTHNLLLKNAAVADGATTRVNAGANLLGANTGSDITVTGSGANGGVVAASAGTPAGTIATSVVDPDNGATMYLRFLLSNSSVG